MIIIIVSITIIIIYLIYIPGCYHLKDRAANTRHTRVCKAITLPFSSASCLFVGEYTEEGLPISLVPSLLLLFTNCRDYGDRILIAPAQGYDDNNTVIDNENV